MSVARLAVVGTGLIGASVGLAARRAGVARVLGWDPDGAFLAVAADRGAVEPAASLQEAVSSSDAVLVAAPVGELPGSSAVIRSAGPRRGAPNARPPSCSTARPGF